eukprot:358307-Chlamydomonas_euryale.AAC.12
MRRPCAQDIQFYTEVMEVVQTLDGGRRNAYDPDEIEEEQRERERRNKINHEFSQFVKRVQELWEKDFHDLGLEFDIPFRELGFNGTPHRSAVFIMPTVNCLIELTEMPFLVLSIADIEIVNLERVGFNLKVCAVAGRAGMGLAAKEGTKKGTPNALRHAPRP